MSATISSHRQPRTPALDNPDAHALRAELRQYFSDTFSSYERLFEVLSCDEAYYKKPIALRHPLIFYFGHTATFFINKLLLTRLISQRINPRFESLFAVGVDEMSWDDLNDQHYDWPTVAEVALYRQQVRQAVLDIIDNSPLEGAITWEHPWWAIIMGIEHERIHLETSSVLIRQHELSMVHSHPAWAPCRQHGVAPENRLITITPGSTHLGKSRQGNLYGWDNEYGQRTVDVAEFAASEFLVSNHEFLAFVKAGAYQQPQWWDEEGLAWQQYSQANMPTFWRRTESGDYRLRLMTEEVNMPWDWPVEVNCLEARAFCKWLSAQRGQPIRLPSEDEWYRVYDVAFAQDQHKANIHLDHFASSCPVTSFKQGDFYDVTGNVWQWTNTPIYPFDGFDVHPIYDDFTTPTFDEKHNLIKGGSWISTGNESLRSARYAFRRHFFQHAGFRYVSTRHPEPTVTNTYYETDRQLSEYAEFHFGDNYFDVPNFPKALAEHGLKACANKPQRRALDLGCATGRASFELAKHFEHVTGIDFSARFINLAVQLADTGQCRYTLVDEGELVSYKSRDLNELGLADAAKRVELFQGDACNLKPQFTDYDFILAANLIDRLYDPALFLAQIHQRLVLGGVLMLTSPYTWLEDHTPRPAWLGGFKKDGESWTTLDALKAHLAPHFRLMEEPTDIPFVIRETRRKYQHSLAEATLWERIA